MCVKTDSDMLRITQSMGKTETTFFLHFMTLITNTDDCVIYGIKKIKNHEKNIFEKMKQISKMKKIISITSYKIYAHFVLDQYMGTGLNSMQTTPEVCAGQNVMRKLLICVAEKTGKYAFRTGSRSRQTTANKLWQIDLDRNN